MKTVSIRISGLLVFALLTIIVFMFLGGGSLKSEIADLNTLLSERDTAIVRYSVTIDSLEYQVAETSLLVIESDKSLKKSEAYAERIEALNLRRVYTIGELNVRIAVLEDSLHLKGGTDTIRVETLITKDDTVPVVRLPFEFGKTNRWMFANASVDTSGLGTIDFMIRELPIELTLGSRGLLRKSHVASVASPNPYVNIDKNNFVVVSSKSKAPLLLGTGALIGGLTVYLLTR